MPKNKLPGTYLDQLKHRLLSNRILAWSVLVFSVCVAIVTLAPRVRDFLGLFPRAASAPPLYLRVLTFDPRFHSGSEVMNWGGGSQTLFIDDGLPALPDSLSHDVQRRQLTDRFDQSRSRSTTVWEVIPPGEADGLVLLIDAAFDKRATNKLIVREWGLHAQALDPPRTGFVAYYTTGGADVGREGGVTRVVGPGDYPIHLWIEQDTVEEGEKPRGPLVEYLDPGDAKFLRINVQGHADTTDAAELSAVVLTAYAIVWVEGKEWRVESANGIRAMLPVDIFFWSPPWASGKEVEDLRPKALVTTR